MRFEDMHGDQTELARLTSQTTKTGKPKKLVGREKARAATLSDRLAAAHQPPATGHPAPTGTRADFQGNVYELHRTTHNCTGQRRVRRANQQQWGVEKPMRSRIQRTRRKQRTGGVR